METPDSGGELMAMQGTRMRAGWMPLKFELGWQGVIYTIYTIYTIWGKQIKQRAPDGRG